MAIDGNRSSFKKNNNYTLDNFQEMVELSPTDAQNVQAWKALKAIQNKTAEQELQFAELTRELASRIVTAEGWNLLLDAMYNLEQAYLDKGLDQIETTLADYVEQSASQDIQDKIGGYVETLLLTNATQVIISNSTPAVINGALWIKPKTT